MDKLIVILGSGESGVGAAILAQKQGFDVWVSDYGQIKENYKRELLLKGIEFEENIHSESKILQATEIIKSPGISDQAPIVQKAREQGIPVMTESRIKCSTCWQCWDEFC